MSESRTYGNLWLHSPPRVGPVSVPAAVLGLVGVLSSLVVLARSLVFGFVVLGFVGLLLVPAVMSDRWGRSGWELVWSHVRFQVARLRGWTLYRSGPLSSNPSDSFDLPGLGSALRVVDGADGFGQQFGVLVDKDRSVTVVLSVSAQGTAMLTEGETDRVVAQWSNFLSEAGHQEGLLGFSVINESITGVGRDLKSDIEDQIVEGAPSAAVEAAKELSVRLGASSPQHRAWSCLTFEKGKGFRGSVSTQNRITDIASRLPKLVAQFEAGCNGSVSLVSADELCWDVFRSLNPSDTSRIDSAVAEGETIGWDEIGPVSAVESSAVYRHGSAISRSWLWAAPPSGEFFDEVIKNLTCPFSPVRVLRTTLLYRPIPQAKTPNQVKKLRGAAKWQMSQDKVSTAATQLQVQSADVLDREIAKGATLYKAAMIVTVSDDDETLPADERVNRLTQAVEGNLGSSRLSFRPATNQQAVCFYAGLPLGRVLKQHVSSIKKWEDHV